MKYSFVLGMVLLFSVTSALAAGLDRPWIADTYFYWYTWDYEQQFGGWVGGVWNTPLYGYYDSPSYRDNLRSLRTAAEWGLTDHFMDYWGPGWKGENGEPREATVMRAAEELQRRGYNIHMSFYQDGEDFDMEDFERNLDVGRHFRFYVENWGDSPALPKIEHEPVYLIYGRNGLPQPTKDNTGFREWLRSRYADLDSLNQAWGTALESWEEVELDFGTGVRRADSIRYATYVWQSQWNRTKHRAVSELRKPAPRVSFDAAYQPYLGWGYSPLPKALGGPHSYAGIFGVPHEQDTERFIQGAVAKAYGTVFFDHFKNYYHDIEIRTPGTIYPPDFLAFDRFWAGALVRRSEALFHLSWNEWWEGSNLEPCWEFGKTYCEKNLLWSSIMQQCFDSLHNWNRGAKVAVLLNDWLWLVGARHTEDVYGCI
ncbi:MAG: beta-galactosidase, partial [Candidatus Zipacnadales bacterium]